MKHLKYIVIATTVGLLGANTAAPSDPPDPADIAPGNAFLADPQFNTVDNLSNYSDDYRWPVPDIDPNVGLLGANTAPTSDPTDPADSAPRNAFLGDPQVNTVDGLSNYSDDYRWPVPDIDPNLGNQEIAGSVRTDE